MSIRASGIIFAATVAATNLPKIQQSTLRKGHSGNDGFVARILKFQGLGGTV
jgi:hypothetical protein